MRICKIDGVTSEDKANDIKEQFESDGCTDVVVKKEGDTYTVTGSCEDDD